MWGSGFNGYGELGLGHKNMCNSFTPVDARCRAPIAAVACSADVTYCLAVDGAVLRSGGVTTTLQPVERLRKLRILGIASMALELVAVSKNVVYVLPNVPGLTAKSLPLPSLHDSIVHVSAGSVFAAVLCSSGRVYTFGINAHGQLGIGNNDTNLVRDQALQEVLLRQLLVDGEHVVDVQCGGCHAVAITNHGTVIAWGSNSHGQLGLGADSVGAVVATPRVVQLLPPSHGSVWGACCGDFHTILLLSGATTSLFGAGRNQCGQLTPWIAAVEDSGSFITTFSPIDVPADLGCVVGAVAGGGHGSSHTVLITAGGTTILVGSNDKGQLGGVPMGGVPMGGVPNVFAFTPQSSLPAGSTLAASAGWRTTVVYASTPMEAAETRRRINQCVPLDEVMPPHLLDLVVQHLSLCDACSFMRTSRVALEVVRCCLPLWEPHLNRRFMVAKVAAQQDQARRREEGVPSEVDWMSVYVQSAQRRFGQVTLFPMPSKGTDNHPGLLGRAANAMRKLFSTAYKFGSKLRLGDAGVGARVLITGLDAAGKTTILYRLKLGSTPVVTIPTIGFNVETFHHGQMDFTCWDVGGPDRIRSLWKHYYQDTIAHMYVVDSCDKSRLSLAVAECHRARREGLEVPLLILANKQDMLTAMNVQEIATQFMAGGPINGKWCVQGCSALSGDGLHDGLDWLEWAVGDNGAAHSQ